jgi:hypothetical protein
MRNTRVVNLIRTVAPLLLILLLGSQPVWAEVRATLNRSTIQAGDTVTLVIEASGRDPGGQPDLSVLERDFEILGTSTSQQIQFINGKRSSRRQWEIQLAPLHDGDIEVPAVPVGSEHTSPLSLRVTDQPSPGAAAAAGEPVFLKAIIEPGDANIHVQQQFNYTLQLYFREPLLNGGFEGPVIDKALVEQLGEDVRYSTRVNGIEYQVIERRYAVFPEESGELVIPEVVFDGHLRSGSGRRLSVPGINSMLDDFMSGTPFGGSGKRIRVRSEPVSVQVKPRPSDYSGSTWLPATQLSLRDSWTDEPPEFRVGEPVTRTLTLEATGLEGSQLPALVLPDTKGMRLYPEQPVQENRSDGKWVYGSSSQSLAYVPTTSGKLNIPEVRVDWWDTSRQQQRTAVLPAWEVNVLPGATPVSQPPPPVPLPPPAAERTEPAAAMSQESRWQDMLRQNWHWITGIMLLAIVITGLAWLASRSRRRPATPVSPADTRTTAATTDRQPRSAVLPVLQQACSGNDPQAAARALLKLAATEWPEDPPRNLAELGRRLPAGVEALRTLEQVLYAPGDTAWRGEELWQQFKNGLPEEHADRTATESGLAPLYPDWDKRGSSL